VAVPDGLGLIVIPRAVLPTKAEIKTTKRVTKEQVFQSHRIVLTVPTDFGIAERAATSVVANAHPFQRIQIVLIVRKNSEMEARAATGGIASVHHLQKIQIVPTVPIDTKSGETGPKGRTKPGHHMPGANLVTADPHTKNPGESLLQMTQVPISQDSTNVVMIGTHSVQINEHVRAIKNRIQNLIKLTSAKEPVIRWDRTSNLSLKNRPIQERSA
jgi:hypothetical protein